MKLKNLIKLPKKRHTNLVHHAAQQEFCQCASCCLDREANQVIEEIGEIDLELFVEKVMDIIHNSQLCKIANKGADWITRRERKRELTEALADNFKEIVREVE